MKNGDSVTAIAGGQSGFHLNRNAGPQPAPLHREPGAAPTLSRRE
jgi:hypothetical protein